MKKLLTLCLLLCASFVSALAVDFDLENGYYYIKSANTDNRPPYLYNDYFHTGNTCNITLQANTTGTTNNYVWYVSRSGDVLTVTNGQGSHLRKGKQNYQTFSSASDYDDLPTVTVGAKTDYGLYFTCGMNASAGAYAINGTYCLTTWAGMQSAADDNWNFEAVSTEGKTVYNVQITGTTADAYVTLAATGEETSAQYAFNGGFFLASSEITAANLTASTHSGYTSEISVSGNTITVTYTQTISADKVYIIKSAKSNTYATMMPGANCMAMTGGTINLAHLYTITPTTTDGATTYQIKSYADPSKYVYYINTNDANANVGITEDATSTNLNWTINAYGSGYNIIPATGSNGWNIRGSESVWGNSAIGQWSGNSTTDNTWYIIEATESEISGAAAAYKSLYIPSISGCDDITSESAQKVGYPTYASIENLKKLNAMTDKADIFNAALEAKNNPTVLHTPTSPIHLFKIKNNTLQKYLYQEANDKNVTFMNDGGTTNKYYWKVTFDGNVATVRGSLGMSPARGAQGTIYSNISSPTYVSPITLKNARSDNSLYTENYFLWENTHSTAQTYYTKNNAAYNSESNPYFLTTWSNVYAANQYMFEPAELDEGQQVYDVVITGAPSSSTAVITYNGDGYEGNNSLPNGGFFILSSATADNFTATAIDGYIASLSLEGTTITATYVADRTSDKETILATATEALSKTSVGYPGENAASRKALQSEIERITALTTVTQSDYDALNTAIEAFYAESSDVNMPEDGKAYTIKMVTRSGDKYYMNYTKDEYEMVSCTDDTELPMTAKLICRKVGDKYTFVNNAGKYFIWRGSNAGANSVKGYNDTYVEDYNLEIFKLTSSLITDNGGTAVSNADLKGYVAIRGWRTASQKSYFVCTSGSYNQGNTNDVWYNDNHSSACIIEETTYANTPTLGDSRGLNGAKYIGTFSAPFPTVIPSDVKAYYVKKNEDNTAYTQEITTEAIPASQGVLLVSSTTSGTVTMLPAASEEADTEVTDDTNLLGNSAGMESGKTFKEDEAYILTTKYGEASFHLVSASTLKMNKSYLKKSADGGSSQQVFLRFNANPATGIEDITADDNEGTAAPLYDLSGRRINKAPGKGIYILDGKKYIK